MSKYKKNKAVALRYNVDEDTSPVVIASGYGTVAEHIIDIAEKIGTFETSIQPYEDCCTVFTPRHPRTRPRLEQVEAAESALDWETLTAEALEGVRNKTVTG